MRGAKIWLRCAITTEQKLCNEIIIHRFYLFVKRILQSRAKKLNFISAAKEKKKIFQLTKKISCTAAATFRDPERYFQIKD